MSEQESPTVNPVNQEEAAFAATVSIHYITMALYTLGFIGTAGNLLLDIVQEEVEHIIAYSILTLLPLLLFFMHLMAVRGLNRRQSWGYRASKGLGILLLLLFPFGTVLGVLLLSQMTKFHFDD